MDSIVINNLTYNYYHPLRKTRIQALNGINLVFERGMRVLICGKNGAGKSTLLSILAGKKLVNEESVSAFNKPVFHDLSLNDRIGYVGEWWNDEYAMNITIKNMFAQYADSKRYKKLMKLFDIDDSKVISGISKGQKKKVQIVSTIMKRKDIYIFDEAAESLDLISRKVLLDFLKNESIKYKCIIIYSTHIFDCMDKWSTHVLYLGKGSVSFFSDINSIVNDKKYVSMADFVFDHMMEETNKNDKSYDIDEIMNLDSD
ncbi:CCR4-associated factor 16, putative [Plasmodium vinckei]|uniref:CCR4-associated factor 16, putative n=1 Tax=Plasmodium vinckei TaxID=5860 RepID=A0A6V7T2D1_PLAVN|nr:CCR4-associated factor 16, putative [Plasmodium vinckei]